MDPIELLHKRRSAAKLCEPAPSPEHLQLIYQAALRAPDHVNLKPWHFFTVAGEERVALGQLWAKCLQETHADYPEHKIERTKKLPLRAPLIIIATMQYQAHDKVPLIEQTLSTGAAVQNMLLAAHALGYGAIWRTGELAYNERFKQSLGLNKQDAVVGFLYIGSIESPPKPFTELNPTDFFVPWNN